MKVKHCLPLFLCLALLLPLLLHGQPSKGNNNYRHYQAKPYYFGLTFGYNESDLQVHHSQKLILNKIFSSVEGRAGSGLNVSMVTNLKLGEYFDFRFLPGFSFVGRKLSYVGANGIGGQEKSFESVLIQAPFQVRFKSAPFHDMKVFVLTGIKYTYDVAISKIRKDLAAGTISMSPHDFSVEAGGGCQFFLPFFILSPEIKYSQGIGNILIYNPTLAQSNILGKVYSRTLTISLHFEG